MTDKTEKLAEIGGQAAAELVRASSPAHSLLASTGLAIAPPTVGLVVRTVTTAYARHLQKKLDAWLQLLADLMQVGTIQDLEAAIVEHIDEPWAYTGVIEGVRAILQDVDDAVLQYLARVTAHYLKSKVVIDRQGKQCVALLALCDARSLAAVRDVVLTANEHFPPNRPVVQVHIVAGQDCDQLFLRVERPGRKDEKNEVLHEHVVDDASLHAFQLLKQHGFAQDNPAGFWGVISGPQVAILQQMHLEFLVPLLK